MKKRNILIVCAICLLWFVSCVKPFAPVVTTTNFGYLVVEGMINLTDSTIIHLSRSVTLGSASTTKNELKATITIESSTGSSYALKEVGNGIYQTPSLNLSTANQYRLRIKTASGSTYLSDFTPGMPAPAIDTITWQAGASNLSIYVSTHDPKNATHYYRWDFSEGWEFYSDYDSFWYSDGLNIKLRLLSQQVYHCWGSDTSHEINLGTSEKLSQDVINQQLINTVPSTIEKLGSKYSIQIKQYPLTKDAYDYWTLLKKNTESLGSIFDSQPSASIGNIHNINNASEPVLGYVSAGTVAGKRIFIEKKQLPTSYITAIAYPVTIASCAATAVVYAHLSTVQHHPPAPSDTLDYPQFEFIDFKNPQFLGYKFQLIPIDSLNPGLPPHPTFSAAAPLCVDCTLRGSSHKPAYWQ